VPEFLSDAWIAALNEAVSAHAGLTAATADVHLTLGYRIDDGPSWHVAVAAGRVRVGSGTADDEQVWFTTDRTTAERLTSGGVDPLEAVIAGDLTIGGDPRVLVAHREVLTGLGDVFAAARG